MILPGYEIVEEIYRGRRRQVWRGRRITDGHAVIIKAPADEFPRPEQLSGLRREYRILSQLDIIGVARPVELVSWHDRVALVLEDLGDTTLKLQIARGILSIDSVLALALELSSILEAMHRRGIIHKDINPNNLMIDPASGRVTLTDFGIATRLSSEAQPPSQPQALEGTLSYMSPEQTGRMHREVDYRTDFYSLGITLYEALTGRLPFESMDPLELIHGHLARAPLTPSQHRPGIPPVLDDLVLRLIAKMPEERYQSARGLRQDLVRMREELTRRGTIERFSLATHDVPERFVVSQQLYGRDAEIGALRAAFDRVKAGSSELVLVAGYSGIGKTSLIQQMYASLPGARGQLITGKFDQLARDVPYRAIADAFRSLLTQVLSEPDLAIHARATAIRAALGNNASVILDVLPELEQIIGQQPPAPVLGGAEAQNRFNRMFQQFVRGFAAPEHPLVVFLDDLQWADAATLTLLPLLLEDKAIPGLLLIGAYRDNEVSPTHSLRLALGELQTRGTPVTEITLAPLSQAEVGQLVGDTLHVPVEDVVTVSALVHRKTDGNPFFVKQLLQLMARDGIIHFNEEHGRWEVDLESAERIEAADNVLTLMSSRIGRLDWGAQQTLQFAACIGARFDLQTLAIVSDRPPAEVAPMVDAAVEAGLLLPPDRSYGFAPDLAGGVAPARLVFQFLHDRVQQAAYAMVPEDQRRQLHLAIGRRLWHEWKAHAEAEGLFEVVNHLNYARDLVTAPDEQRGLAELNLAAGRRARASAAYPSALGYFTAGAALIQAQRTEQHALAFALLIERGEAEYLTGRLQDAESTLLSLLEQCRTPLERAEVAELLIIEYETLSRYDDAIRIGLEALQQLGVELPASPEAWEPALHQDVAAIQRAIGPRTIAALADLPVLEDPRLRHVLRLLQSSWTPSYVSGRSRLGDLLVARLVLLSVQYGNCEASAFGYLHHAITVGSVFGEYARGAELGELALAVNERFNDLRLRAVVYHRFAALVAPWRNPFTECVRSAREAVRAATESGNLPVEGYAEFQQGWYGMLLEPDLAAFTARHQPTVDLLTRLQIHSYADMQRIMVQWAAALRGATADPVTLDGPGFSDEHYRRTIGQGGIFRALHATVQLDLLYTFGRHDEALRFAQAEAAGAEVFVGSIWPAMFAFRHGLALAAMAPALAPDARDGALSQLATIEARFARWAASAPANFRTMHLLLQAERARLADRPGAAITAYEAALEATAQEPSPRHRALANELYGEFWLQRKQPRVAQAFLAEARYGYEQWGAIAKVRQLDERHARLVRQVLPAPVARASLLQTTSTLEGSLDVAGIMKAAQAIVREIDLEQLLERVITIALETAGADHGALLLEREGQPLVRVVASPRGVDILPDTVAADSWVNLPAGVIQLVRRTREPIVLGNAATDGRSAHDPYVLRERPRSVLCIPILNQGKLIGVFYLENRLTTDAFTGERVRVLQLLSAQAAIALENAQLYERSRQEVADRTRAEAKLRSIAEGTARVTAAEFFPSLVRHLALGLKVRQAFVAECIGKSGRVRTLAYWADGALVDNVEFPLEGTPCERVCSGEMCFHPDNVAQLFPGDPPLAEMGIVSYLGLPLLDSSGEVVGHVAVLDSEPMAPDEDDLALIRIFAARGGAELERKQTGDALRQSQQQYSTMAEAVPEILFTADANGMLDYLSRRFTDYTGMRPEEGLGAGWFAAVHPEDQERTVALVSHSLQTGFPFEGEYRLKGTGGEYRWFRTRAVPLNPAGGERRWFGVASDVDDSKRAEVALRDALDEVRRLKDRLQTENVYLQEQIASEHGFEEIVGRSAILRKVLGAVEQVAPVDTTVLIAGETGTGKELLARAIHRLSPRRDHPLVTVNCGAVAPGLIESELFGHEKGAFTGALSRRLGRFEVADGGTLFLDEIGDLALDLQVKLLRVLQEGEFERVGGGKQIRVNVRVIAASHRDLESLVREGKFRADLFYRLNVFPIRAPALRERREDVPELVRYFVLKHATRLGKRIDRIPHEVLERLGQYNWPGNIRELANIIERSVILTRGNSLELESQLGEMAVASLHGAPLLNEDERQRIVAALEQTGWRVSGPKGAALILGIKPTTLEARMKRLGLKRPG
jgi:PAS domain S-box-containing protein